MSGVPEREITLSQPFSVVTTYDDGSPDAIFYSAEIDGSYHWPVTEWNGSTTYVNVGGVTYPLDEVEEK